MKLAALLVLSFALFAPLTVLAQSVMDAPPLGDDVGQLAGAVLTGVDKGEWGLVAAAGVVLLVLGVRKFGAQLFPSLAPILASKYAGPALAVVGSTAGAILTALMAGQGVTPGLILKAVFIGVTGIGIHSGAKNIAEARAAGKAAAAEIRTDEDAANTLRLPPA